MLGAYEGLMKAAPQAMPQPAQSMGGRAMPATWRDVPGVAEPQIDSLLKEIDDIHAKYTNGPMAGLDVLPEDAAHIQNLHQMLNSATAAREHALGKIGSQAEMEDRMRAAKQESERTRAELKRAGAGAVPPRPVR
jgi:uncharacterized small protein (DUF1192 family)